MVEPPPDWEASTLIIILYFHSYFNVIPYMSHLPDLKTVTIKEFTLKDVTPTDLWDNHKITNYFTHLTTHLINHFTCKQQAGLDLCSKGLFFFGEQRATGRHIVPLCYIECYSSIEFLLYWMSYQSWSAFHGWKGRYGLFWSSRLFTSVLQAGKIHSKMYQSDLLFQTVEVGSNA